MRRLLAMACAAAAVCGGLLATGTASATTHSLPAGAVGRMLVDDRVSPGRIFFTEGDNIVVTDLSGATVMRIPAPAATGLAMSPDGHVVYASTFASPPSSATGGSLKILKIDATSSSLSTTPYDLGTTVCPNPSVAFAGTVWVGYTTGSDCTTTTNGAIRSADLSGSTAVLGSPTPVTVGGGQPVLLAGAVDTLVVAAGGGSAVDVYDVSSGALPTTHGTSSASCATLRSVGITPDAALAVLACGSGQVAAVNTSDFSDGPVYPDPTSGIGAVAASAVGGATNGLVAAGFSGGGQNEVLVYDRAGTLLQPRSINLGSETLADGGLAFGHNGTLYALTSSGSTAYTLNVVPRQPTSLTIRTDRARYRYGALARVTVHLGTTLTNRHVRVYMKPYNGLRVRIADGDVDAAGTLTVTRRVYRRTRFTAGFGGDLLYAPASTSTVVLVHAQLNERLRGYYDTVGAYRIYHAGESPELDARIWPNQYHVCLYFRAQYYSGGGWHNASLSPCVRTDTEGRADALLNNALPLRYRLRAEWRGNAVSLPSVGPWLRLRFR